MPSIPGMKAAGYYDQHSGAQFASIEALHDWVERAVAAVPLPSLEWPITVADLGSSEGANAIRLMSQIAQGLRQRSDQPLVAIYCDLFSNNFNQLFSNLDRARQSGLFPAGVYHSAVGGSFYGSVLPPASVHFATSFNSVVWLDQLPPVPVTDFVACRRTHPQYPGRASSSEVAAAFARQAEHDLVRFLEGRAKELVHGGKLLISTPGESDEARVVDGLFDVLNDACLDLVASGRLERAAYERLTMPLYYRNVADLRAPVERSDSPLSELFSVDRAEALEVPIPFWLAFQRTGDARTYAAAYTGLLRAITEPVVRRAFEPSAAGADTIEALYDRVAARLQADPERYRWRYITVSALFTRR
jgi:gibberellin A4 carboxyl methyltransferase